MPNADTVELLKAHVAQWEQASYQMGQWHGSDVFQNVATAVLNHLGGTNGILEQPVPTTRRVLPRAFLVEWSTLIAKSRWRISKKWFEDRRLPVTLVPVASRITKVQQAGHDVGVDRLLTLWRLPTMLRMICAVAGGSFALWQTIHDRKVA